MSTSILPLKIFRDILEIAVNALGPRRALKLRLVDRFFDQETLRAYANAKMLKSLLVPGRPGMESENRNDFIARYLVERPHTKNTTPLCNLSALINYVVDEVVKRDDKVVASEESRHQYIKTLCRKIDNRALSWDIFPVQDFGISDFNVRCHLVVAAVYLRKYAVVRQVFNDIKINDIGSEIFGTPLVAALETRQYDVVRELLQRGANVNMGTLHTLQMPLEEAVVSGDLAIVHLLLEPQYGCDTSSRNRRFQTSIVYAILSDHLDIVHLLLERSSDPLSELDIVLHDGLCAASQQGHIDIVRLLMDHVADYHNHFRRLDKSEPLIQAAWKGREDVLRFLLSRGASPYGLSNCHENSKRHSMCAVALGGHVGAARILLGAGLRLDHTGWATILSIAAPLLRSADLIQMLLDDGVFDINEIHNDHRYVEGMRVRYISAACVRGNAGFVTALAQRGVNIRDKSMYARQGLPLPIIVAAAFGHHHLVKVLLELGSPEVDSTSTSLNTRTKILEVIPKLPFPPESRLEMLFTAW